MNDLIKFIEENDDVITKDGATINEISQAQTDLDVKFAKDYIEILKTYGIVITNSHELTGICKSPRLNVVDVTLEERKYNPQAPLNLYVIEQANIDGIVIWQAENGEVFQSSPNQIPFKICNSLLEYINL